MVTTRPRRVAAPAPAARLRPVIEGIRPLVDGGRFRAKAAVGDDVVVEADVFVDGHDLLRCEVRHQCDGDRRWAAVPMQPLGNDRWRARFPVDAVGPHRFTVHADVDRWGTWTRDLAARVGAGQDVAAELGEGAALLAAAAGRAKGADRAALAAASGCLADAVRGLETDLPDLPDRLAAGDTLADLVFGGPLADLARRYGPSDTAVTSPPCPLVVEPALARFANWYELFPRSASPDADRPGTLADVVDRLPYLARLGVDVLYLPPVHPIGTTSRKGPNGAVIAGPDDPGSPWAIGSADGGHTAVHPDLGTLGDFDRLVAAAAERGITVALDLAFQCSPDHPWVADHPQWFRHRPDGSIRFAENPPKQYQDIFPLDFDTPDWVALWEALAEVVWFWMDHGVSVFRVDNPHTKPFGFWEWLIGAVKADRPDVLFLSEAFTRPRVMERLAKVGFSQSYTYFTWRRTKWELQEYLTELAGKADYLRPNFWPNTPDILTDQLQTGGTPAFIARLVLAATLAASYGIYGPAFELQQHAAREPGSEEYAGSEKYAVRHWDLDAPDSLADLVGRVNAIRHDHPALQYDHPLTFHHVDNDQLIAYSKSRGDDVVLVVVNLDPVYPQAGWLDLDLAALAVAPDRPFVVHDLLTDAHYRWDGARNYVALDPAAVPAHVLAVRPVRP
ncbi:MAG TPA: alpha-1,4-glucan--maltose-1-phosphate maltosyltransferase [Acidimicrobiales bacterium]|nr:alpha-1,4-glucan--maltose-1-phosphate maltosyltransferase [Acidimicrobiales bacterium]